LAVVDTLGAEFCVEALEKPLSLPADRRSSIPTRAKPVTSTTFTGTLERHKITISMEGKGPATWTTSSSSGCGGSFKYEGVYLKRLPSVRRGQGRIGSWLAS